MEEREGKYSWGRREKKGDGKISPNVSVLFVRILANSRSANIWEEEGEKEKGRRVTFWGGKRRKGEKRPEDRHQSALPTTTRNGKEEREGRSDVAADI